MADVEYTIKANDEATAAINKVNDALEKSNETIKDSRAETDAASKSQREFESTVNNLEKALGYVKRAYEMTVVTTVAYADEVRGLQQVTGASAEETSRLIQVLDDYKVSSQQATEAQRYLTKQGIVLTTDALAKLSDEYVGLTGQADKNAFAQKNLGRNYKAFVEVLQQGGDVIRKNSAAVDESLIMTQKAMDSARSYQVALDGWNDSVMALQVSIGNKLLPTLVNMMNSTDDNRRAVELLREAGDEQSVTAMLTVGAMSEAAKAAMEQARAEREAETAMKSTTQAAEDEEPVVRDLTQAYKDYEAALKAASDKNMGLFGLTTKMQSEIDGYNKTLAETITKYGEASQEVKDLQLAHEEAMKKIAYDLYITKLQADGFTDAEYDMAIAAGVAAGVIDEETAKMALSMDKTVERAIALGEAFYTAEEKARALAGEYVVSIRTIYSSSDYGSDRAYGAYEPIHGHASGGDFLIPQSYGNEGFQMGNGDTASAGERVTITPKGQTPGAPAIDYDELSRALVSALQKAGAR